MANNPNKITFKYVYPEDLRDLYINGLYGGVTPRGEIYIHFYSERHPIPKKATHNLDEQGVPSKEADMEIGGDVVRLVQASIALDISTAIAMRDWLNERINYINASQKEAPHGAQS